MNDTEKIIKGIEICGDGKPSCKGCPYYEIKSPMCLHTLHKEATDLIHSQQAEIEKLKKLQQRQADLIIEERGRRYELASQLTTLKAEAIREFAERLNAKFENYAREDWYGTKYFLVGEGVVNKVASEMFGNPEQVKGKDDEI